MTNVSGSPTELRRAVQGYYDALDAGDNERVLEFFSGDVLYLRPGYERVAGIERLREYYEDSRKLKPGRHVLRSILVDGAEVAVHGEYEGELKDGSRTSVGFAAFFTFDGNDRASEHFTYFFVPAV